MPGVSRSGWIPEPTVTVRKKEKRGGFRFVACLVQAFAASSRALILANPSSQRTMNQICSSIHSAVSRASSQSDGDRTPRVAVIAASWHADIVGQSVDAIRAEFARSSEAPQLDRFDVPGAFEIPLLAQRLARTGRYDAIIACGLVVDGGIYKHEFVGVTVIDALMRVQLDTDVPVLSAVLTPHHFHDHEEHRRFFSAHFVTKGTEVARACLATIAVTRAAAAL